MQAKHLEILHEFGLATQVTPGGMLGNTYVRGYQGDDMGAASPGGQGKTAYPQGKKKKKKHTKAAQSNEMHGVASGSSIGERSAMMAAARPNPAMGGLSFSMERKDNPLVGSIFLGLPSDYFEHGEKRLGARLKQLLAQDVGRRAATTEGRQLMRSSSGYVSAPSSQVRTPIEGPIPTHPTNPNPNPNAVRNVIPDPNNVTPHSGDILGWLRKKQHTKIEFGVGLILDLPAAGKKMGLKHIGHMSGLHWFNDPHTKSTIAVKSAASIEDLAAKLKDTRNKFRPIM